jgi:hypothetical protein
MFKYIFSPKNINLTKAPPFHINSHLTSCNLTKNSAGQKPPGDQTDYTEANNNLGIALARKGKMDEAISRFRETI